MRQQYWIFFVVLTFCFPNKGISQIKSQKDHIRFVNISKQDFCGLIQVTVILDNNCNGIFDSGDEVARDVNVNLGYNSTSINTSSTNINGLSFFSHLSPGSYSTTIDVPTGWEITSSKANANLAINGVGTMEYFLCATCGCFDTSGPPEQSLTIPNNVLPSLGARFIITDPDFSPFQVGAYNANEYLLVIFNRWGGEVHRSTRKDCNGLKNGEIVWDGKDNNGNQLQQENYNGYLVLQNCDYYCKNDEWSSNLFNGLLNRCPDNVKYFNIILAH